MATVALRAHFDGKHVVLDEPYDLEPNASLLVTVLEPVAASGPGFDPDSEEFWLRAVGSSESFAFLANPAEDIYSATDGEPFHPDAP
jgi:hypothetical protein